MWSKTNRAEVQGSWSFRPCSLVTVTHKTPLAFQRRIIVDRREFFVDHIQRLKHGRACTPLPCRPMKARAQECALTHLKAPYQMRCKNLLAGTHVCNSLHTALRISAARRLPTMPSKFICRLLSLPCEFAGPILRCFPHGASCHSLLAS